MHIQLASQLMISHVQLQMALTDQAILLQGLLASRSNAFSLPLGIHHRCRAPGLSELSANAIA